MSRKILVGGLDPSLTGSGMCRMSYDLVTGDLELLALHLEETAPSPKKIGVRPSSDALRRSSELAQAYRSFFRDVAMIFTEVPSGGQDYKAVHSFGITVGHLGFLRCYKPLIEIQPNETKILSTGIKNADKPEILEWAVNRWPDAAWIRQKFKGSLRLVAKNHNMADACAVVVAGTQLEEFRRSVAMMRSAA